MKNFLQFLLLFFFGYCLGQLNQNQQEFEIEVSVIEKYTDELVTDAQVRIEGKTYSFANHFGKYKVIARVGEELIVSHPAMETVYHTIKRNDDIQIYIEGDFKQEKNYKKSSYQNKRISSTVFKTYIDSAYYFKNKDLDKSISFIEKILKQYPSKKQTAESYEMLGDVYLQWNQYDLAIENYSSSLKVVDENKVTLKLANTALLDNKLSLSKRKYQELLKVNLTDYQKIKVNQGLGEVFLKQKKYTKSEKYFKRALSIAKANSVTPKITDINSKLAELYLVQGKKNIANTYYKNSLDLASKQNKKRALTEKEKVADFYNQSNQYDKEIELRKEILEEAEEVEEVAETKEDISLELKEVVKNKSEAINSQKSNYKIGNAYVLKEEYNKAIPYLEKSIKEAASKEDLIVEKFATRKLSEVYASVGDYDKALKTYQNYVALVDTLYVRKEQEMIRAKRFGKKIADNQNRIKTLEKDRELTKSKIVLAQKEQELAQESNIRQQLFIYALILGFLLMSLLAYLLYRNTQQQKLANNLLALKSMRSQMNPHFIFNALNSVNSFIAVNDELSANRYLSQFSLLMRAVLENSDEDFISLSKEIELLELYTKLEHNRFKDKFDYVIDVDKAIKIDEYQIPPMLLQPYIENAIWHGLRYKKDFGKLQITLQKYTDDAIKIVIEDNGVGRKKSMQLKTKNQLKQKSKGMKMVKNRISILNSMYKNKIKVHLEDLNADGTGTRVTVILQK